MNELANLQGLDVVEGNVNCPDGCVVQIDLDAPLLTCGILVQENLVVMQKQGNEHVVTGAVSCFSASWSLDGKFNKPMVRIHKPVADYTLDIAKRVPRLFEGFKSGGRFGVQTAGLTMIRNITNQGARVNGVRHRNTA